MPAGTPVHRCYEKLKGKHGKASAARICQSSTGKSLATGRKPKRKRKKNPHYSRGRLARSVGY